MIPKNEILQHINNDKASPAKRKAREGLRYYEGEHDIKDYKLYYFDADGELQEDKYRTNVKISHPFFSELVDQCTDYLLSGKNRIVRSDIPELQQRLDEYFHDDFKDELGEATTYSQVEGRSYLYRYTNEDMISQFKFADYQGVVEVDGKLSSDGNNYVIYYYPDEVIGDDTATIVTIERVQVWDKSDTYYYVVRDGVITEDEDEPLNPRPHTVYKEDDKLYFDVFDDIPFYRLDNNRKKESELKRVKALIDDYDIHACSLTNDIQDFNSALYVVKGYNGDNLDELQHNLKTKKVLGVGEGGGIEVKTIDIPYEARQVKLELDEKNIYKFGFGFNAAQVGDGNVTNVVIKSRYALLDLKCNRIENNIRALMKDLIRIALDEINEANETGYTEKDVYMVFEREIISNEVDNANIELMNAQKQQVAIGTLLSLSNYIGDQTVLELIGEVLDIDITDIDLATLQVAKTDLNAASEQLLDGGLGGV
ncbi:phage portal protein [Eubacteriales bacterium OttesenSCG-928-M02]|nr:phage portal protein [Eubacteriales bacterium OttesenSCG-928-M02]